MKGEPTDDVETGSFDGDSLSLSVSPPPTALQPPMASTTSQQETPVILEGKRRRKSRMPREYLREVMDDDDDNDLLDGDNAEDDANKIIFEKKRKEREEDADFRPGDTHGKRSEMPPPTINPEDVLGKCCFCAEYLRYEQIFSHMAEKHPDDVVRRLVCPLCGVMPNPSSLERHVQVGSSQSVCLSVSVSSS